MIIVRFLDEKSTKVGSSSSNSEVKLLQDTDRPNIHDYDALAIDSMFKDEYDQLVWSFYSRKCIMVLIKNVAHTSIDDCQFFVKDHTIFAQIIDEYV